jgi:hypothetical protein
LPSSWTAFGDDTSPTTGVNEAGASKAKYDAVVLALSTYNGSKDDYITGTNSADLNAKIATYNSADASNTGNIARSGNDTSTLPGSFVYSSSRSLTAIGMPTSWTAETVMQNAEATAAVDPLAKHFYLVENAAGKTIELTLTGAPSNDVFYTFNADGNAVPQGVHGGFLITDAKKIAFGGTVGNIAGDRAVGDLLIDADSTSTTTLKVTSFTDTVNGGNSTTGKINNGEARSAVQTVTLVPAASVSVTTKMSATTDRDGSDVVATVTLGSNVNPYAVAGSMGVVYYADGSNITLAVRGISDAVSGAVEYFATAAADVGTTTGVITATAAADGAFLDGGDLKSGVYTARAIFLNTVPDIYAGARSVALDLRDGTNTTVDGAEVTFTASDNVAVTAGNSALVREGVKSLAVVGQIQKAAGDYAAAGVRVSATITGVTVDADSTITVTGSADEIVEAGDVITVYGFSNSDGEFPITINSTTGENLDQVSVQFAALLSTGLYGAGAAETVTWQTAALEADLEVTPSEFLTGSTVNVTFTAVDQFGVGMDSTDNGRVSVRVDAFVDGTVKTATYSETKATTNGSASFSFANFATAGSNQEIKVTVLQASTAGTPAYFTVYNNVATSAIAIADVFSNRVQYVDAVTGSTAAVATLKAATDAGVIAAFTAGEEGVDFATIVGTALDANNAGQPGAAVTIAAAGVLFHDAETKTIATDSITVIANGQGYFDVQALSHKANSAGLTVTVTAGGVTKTTLLKSYLSQTISAANLKFSWELPSFLVKNTTYSVAASLTDVWGNPLQTIKQATGAGFQNLDALTVSADGSLQVNGVASVARNFNNNGQATVFVRSVTDVAGPGQLRASVGSLNYYTGGPTAEFGKVTNTTDVYTTDITTTSWNETLWSGALAIDVDVLDAAPVAEKKVNAGSFKGYVAVYARGYEGQRLSAKIGNDWIIVDEIVNNQEDGELFRVTDFTGAGVEIAVRIYIDRVLIATINLTTK